MYPILGYVYMKTIELILCCVTLSMLSALYHAASVNGALGDALVVSGYPPPQKELLLIDMDVVFDSPGDLNWKNSIVWRNSNGTSLCQYADIVSVPAQLTYYPHRVNAAPDVL